jgi:hypothetical protein
MTNEEFSRIRHYLGKSQKQMAQLLCISPKAVQSFEQKWRQVPVYVERQLLLLLSMKANKGENIKPCWESKGCADAYRQVCIVWEYKSRYCWLISGTMYEGKVQNNWQQKIKTCRKCDVFQAMMPVEVVSTENII